jgi:hypothetical protein
MATGYQRNLGKFAYTPFVRQDGTFTREAALEIALLERLTGGSSGVIFADQIGFTPAGSIVAVNVQAALQELDTEKASATALAGKQDADATLTALAGVTTAADRLIYATGADVFTVTPFTAAARALLDDVDAAAMRTTLDAEAEGTALLLLASHVADPDPHTQYALDSDLAAKQDTLVSGTNLKTVNGASLLGSGNLVVGGGGSGDVVGPGSAVANHVVFFDGTSGKLIKDSGLTLAGTNTGDGPVSELANVTLGSNGVTLATASFAAKNWLSIQIYLPGQTSGDTPSLQFNGDTGNNYRYHWTHINASATALTAGLRATTTDRVKIGSANSVMPRNVRARITNFSADTEKLVQFDGLVGTGAVGTNPQTQMGQGAWISAAATQITSVTLVSTSNMMAGTQLVVHGWN